MTTQPAVDKDTLNITCAEDNCDHDVERSVDYRCDECQEHYCYNHLFIDDCGQLCRACHHG